MDVPMLTTEIISVFSVLGLVIVLLVFDILRVDVIGLLVMTLLPVTGLLTPGEAVAGLGSKAVIVLICVMVIGASLNKTGVMTVVAQKIMNVAGKSQSRIVSLVALGTALPSAFMSNVGCAALMLPATLVVAISSINTLILPTHQVNALIMQPGGYKTKDYVRVGSGVMVLFILILIVMLAFFY